MANKDIVKNVLVKIRTDVDKGSNRGYERALGNIKRSFGSISKYQQVAAKYGDKFKLTDSELLKIQQRRHDLAMKNLKIQKEQNKAKQREALLSRKNGASLGFNLSLMFIAMRIQRDINNMLKSMVHTYMQITQGQTIFSNAVNRSIAAVDFLKFSLINAFASTKFGQGLVNLFVKLVNWVSKFTTKHPKLALSIVIGGAAISSVSGLIVWATQIALLVNSWVLMSKLKNIAAALSLTTPSKDELSIVTKLANWAKDGINIGAVVSVSKKILGTAGLLAAAAVLGETVGSAIGAGIANKFGDNLFVDKLMMTGEKIGYYIVKGLNIIPGLGDAVTKIFTLGKYKSVKELGGQISDVAYKMAYIKYKKDMVAQGTTPESYAQWNAENKRLFIELNQNLESHTKEFNDFNNAMLQYKQSLKLIDQTVSKGVSAPKNPLDGFISGIDTANSKLQETKKLLDEINGTVVSPKISIESNFFNQVPNTTYGG